MTPGDVRSRPEPMPTSQPLDYVRPAERLAPHREISAAPPLLIELGLVLAVAGVVLWALPDLAAWLGSLADAAAALKVCR